MNKKIYADLLNNRIKFYLYNDDLKNEKYNLNNSLILSGSFNPLHEGHIELLKASSKEFKKNPLFEISIKKEIWTCKTSSIHSSWLMPLHQPTVKRQTPAPPSGKSGSSHGCGRPAPSSPPTSQVRCSRTSWSTYWSSWPPTSSEIGDEYIFELYREDINSYVDGHNGTSACDLTRLKRIHKPLKL